ncbi:MAG: FG-GAP-like repeat-containing protein [Deltaproteobacteria bacterium]|nr:FG-GAP-like repeat-containing protein [Deltaproteobacteria bacterium]
MKILCKWVIFLLCIIASAQPLWAKEKNVVAVLPFSVTSSENIDFIRQGIVNMVSSRLSVNEKIEVVGKDQVQPLLPSAGGKELTPAEILALGKKLNADFVVWGSITKIGNSLSIDGKLFDIAANKSALAVVAQSQGMDDVIPKINDFTQRVENHIAGAPPQVVTSAAPMSKEIIVSRQQPPPTPQNAREAEIISGMKSGKRGTMTALINPDFINAEQPLNRNTFWKSSQYPYEIKGMDIGDVNGDGLNETVVIDRNNIFIYQRKGTAFTLLQQIKGNSSDNYIALDVADINDNGIKEIIVTNHFTEMISSFVIEYKNGKFVPIATGLRWFLRVIDKGDGIPLLMGQRLGIGEIFEQQIYEIVWKNGEYREGAKLRIPKGLSIFGLTLAKLTEGGPEKVIALNDNDYLCVFEQTDKLLSQVLIFGGSDEFTWKSEAVFGGSNTIIDVRNTNSAQAQSSSSGVQNTAYINLRILTYDTNKDGKREIIIVRNNSSSGRLLQNIKLFSSAEVFDLEWDNLGMVENWRTKKINGYVSDYQFKDIDNDGENEVVLSLVVSVGGSLRGRSMVVAYELNKP